MSQGSGHRWRPNPERQSPGAGRRQCFVQSRIGPPGGPRFDLGTPKAPALAGLREYRHGIRTPVSAVRGRRPSPLDDGGSSAGDCSEGLAIVWGRGYAWPVHRPVVEGSPVRSRRGPATVNGRRCVADATGALTALREGAARSPKPGDLAPVVRHTTLEEKGGSYDQSHPGRASRRPRHRRCRRNPPTPLRLP